MIISIGSYKVRVEILIAIVVVFWIIFGYLLCGCCKMNLFEGFREGLNANILTNNLKKEGEKLEKLGKEAMSAKEQVDVAIERFGKQNCEYETLRKQLEQAKAQAQELYQKQEAEQAAFDAAQKRPQGPQLQTQN